MTLMDYNGSCHGSALQCHLEEGEFLAGDEFGCSVLVDEKSLSDSSGNNRDMRQLYSVCLNELDNRNLYSTCVNELENRQLHRVCLTELEHRNSENTRKRRSARQEAAGSIALEKQTSVKQFVDAFSKNVDAAQETLEDFTRRRGDDLAKSISFAQRHPSLMLAKGRAEEFANRRSTTFSKNIDYLTRSSGSLLAEQAEQITRSSGNSLANSIDSVQEAAEAFTRQCGDSITKNIDFAQEQAELFTRFLATSVFGGGGANELDDKALSKDEGDQATTLEPQMMKGVQSKEC